MLSWDGPFSLATCGSAEVYDDGQQEYTLIIVRTLFFTCIIRHNYHHINYHHIVFFLLYPFILVQGLFDRSKAYALWTLSYVGKTIPHV